MILIQKDMVNDIPLLHVAKQTELSSPLPTIIFIHGFTSAKEHNLHFAYLLAEKGYRVLLPDVSLHGERQEGLDDMVLSTRFWHMVIQTIDELQVLKDYYTDKGLVSDGRIGLAGSSMGGIITLGALTQYDWVKTAVSLMGSPTYVGFAKAQLNQFKRNGLTLPMTDEEIEEQLSVLTSYDLSLNPEKVNRRPLLFWHGKQDTVVPFEPTYAFFKTIYPSYKDNPDDLRFISEEQAGHKVSRKALLETTKWFQRRL
ncbi:alpha/beta fold hydrolase [Jeotgalibacillus campisalis]|uniref:Esterase n=1 Tax=Jeotgalibacillus campisalis TaxID=220754 RepID=A0A0C2RZY9_9BACL|nr:alpha/beta fold hydrolase [Jeotgalibacillus campisalis]KIL47389.1 esterase [Jeotgalibacillus campisalis]